MSGLSNTRDTQGHGTRVAGIAAALTHNGTGMAGVAGGWGGISQNMGARLIPLRVGSTGSFSVTSASQGIDQAVQKGADIINISFRYSDQNQTLNQSCYNAFAQGVVTVAFMGNDGSNATKYPAGLGGKGDGGFVLAVGATDANDDHRPSSNTGNHIDVVAPGENIKSLSLTGTIIDFNGTSASTPVVSGISALLLSYNSSLTDRDVKELISRSADKVLQMDSADWTDKHGWGRVNALQALQLLEPPNVLSHVTVSGGMSSQLTWNTHQHTFYNWFGPNDLNSGVYTVKQYRVYKSIAFPLEYSELPQVWARIIGTTGWGASNPNYQYPHVAVVPGTLTNTGCTVETYVYEVWNTLGQYLGYKPASPSNVTLEITVLGKEALSVDLSGPGTVEPNVSNTWTANVSGGNGSTSYQWYVKYEGSSTGNPLGTSQNQSHTFLCELYLQ